MSGHHVPRYLMAAACTVVCIAACTTADDPVEENGNEMRPIDIDRAERLHMPQVPPIRDGHLTVVGGGDVKPEYVIDGSWSASALRCDSVGMVQLIARGEGFGAAILFTPPDTGTAATTYTVQNAEDGPILPGTARLGVQWFPEDRPYVFRGSMGTLELTGTRERLAGYFTTEFFETSFLDSMYMAGSFAGVRIERVTGRQCDVIPADSADGDSP